MTGRLNVTFDLSDRRDIADSLRLLAAREHTTQKALFVEAMEAFLAQRQENAVLLDAAKRTFIEWESEEDKVYDTF
jgi:hypothetical protein